ncbi:hypothetical protein FRB97_009598 [Tulasnella sp. 331]|nr:hypothetical protein FRB97_009598 [Tulasnella sp. 331]
MSLEPENATGSASQSSSSEAVSVMASNVLVQATPCSDLSNVDGDEDSCGQMSLICGLLRPQTQQQHSQLKQSIASKSPLRPNFFVSITKALDLELEESMLHAETGYTADLCGGQDSPSACHSNRSNRSAASPSAHRSRPFASVLASFPNHAQTSSSTRSPRRAVLVENTCSPRQCDTGDNENARPAAPSGRNNHIASSNSTSSRKENDPSSCESVALSSVRQESVQGRDPHSTAFSPATRRAAAATVTTSADASVPSGITALTKSAGSTYHTPKEQRLGEQPPPTTEPAPRPAPTPNSLVKTAKSAPGRPQPRLKPLSRSTNTNTTPPNAFVSPAQHNEAAVTPTGPRDRLLGRQAATTPLHHFIEEATQLEENPPNPIQPRLQSPADLEMRPRDSAAVASNHHHTARPTTPRAGQRSPPRRAPTTPTTALRPAGTTTGCPAGTPSEDSFTRPTAAEERERWLRSTDAQALHVSVGRLAGVSGFETQNGAVITPARRLLQTRAPRTPSPRRRGPATPKTSPGGPASSRKSPKGQRPRFGLASPARSPRQLPQRGRPSGRYALRERNNEQDVDADMFEAGPSSRAPISVGQQPLPQPHVPGGVGKERDRKEGRGRKPGRKDIDMIGSDEDESLHSQLSQMSFGSPPPASKTKSRSRSRHHRPHPEAENVLVPHTPTNSSGSLGGQPSRPPLIGARHAAGFDLDAPLPMTDSQKSRSDKTSSSNFIPPAAQPPSAPRRKLRSPTPISYVTNSSGEQLAIPMEEDIFRPLTPPNPVPARTPGDGNDGLRITPTQPSEIQDSQHPAVIAARQRFTESVRGSTTTIGVSQAIIPELPQPPRAVASTDDRAGVAVRLGRRLDFSAGAKPNAPGPSDAGRPPVLAAPPPFIERITGRPPSGGGHQRMTSGPKIFPPVRAKPPSYAEPANETTIMDIDVNEVISGTPDDPIASSSSPRHDAKGKGRAVDVDVAKRRMVAQPLGPTHQAPPKRTFRQLDDDAEEAELPSEIDFTMATQQAQVLARKKLSERKSSPAAPHQRRIPITTTPKSPRRGAAATGPRRSPKQYTSHAKLERDSAKKRRRQQERGDATSEDEVEIEVNQNDMVASSEVDLTSPTKTKPSVKRARSLSTRPSGSTESPVTKKRQAKKRKTRSLHWDYTDFPMSRVFAKWSKNKFFYPGTVVSRSEKTPNKLTVRFDDDTFTDVDVSKVRLGILQLGDVVQVVDRWRETGVVRDVSGWTKEERWSVEIALKDKDGDEEQMVCEGKNLRVHEKEINRQWDDRMLGVDEVEVSSDVLTGGEQSAEAPPEPEPVSPEPQAHPNRSARRRSSTRAAPVAVVPRSATRRPSGSGAASGEAKRGVFSTIAFVITMHPTARSDAAKDRERTSLRQDITQGGGTVYDSWDSLYTIQGKDGITDRRDVRWIGPRRGVTTVLLLADQPTQTAKYLMALALGVPCVSSAWIKDRTAGLDFGWRSYLLAAGRSNYLGTEVSQLFDQAWSTDESLLHDVFRSRIVRRPWMDLRILCVFSGGKRKSGDPQANQRYPQMMVAMGAESVEVVTNVKNASNVICTYDYVVLADENLVGMTKELKGAGAKQVGGVNWFKQCLITGLALSPD